MNRLDQGIVTPEAVLLDFEVAGLASRLCSRVIDGFVLLGCFWALGAGANILVPTVGATATAVVLLVGAIGLFFAYPVVTEARWQGRTVGRRVLGLRAVTNEGGPVRARHAVVRSLFQLVDIPLGLGVLAGLLSAKTQRLGDLAAGTFVVREPKSGQVAGAVVFPTPMGFEWLVASLDVGGLGPRDYELVRSYLLRTQELTPAARAHLSDRLVDELSPLLRRRPPAMISPELFLACVAAAWQRRHGAPFVPAGWAPPPGWTPPAPSGPP
jgi:uncharacterized RDD family membrane protein YckC